MWSRKSLSNLILFKMNNWNSCIYKNVFFGCLKKLHLHVLLWNKLFCSSKKKWVVCTLTSLKQNWPWNVKWCNHDNTDIQRQAENHKTISTLLRLYKHRKDNINLTEVGSQLNVFFYCAQFRKMTTQKFIILMMQEIIITFMYKRLFWQEKLD